MRVLAISHETSATGAPIFFHTLLNWFKGQSKVSMDVVAIKDGVIRDQFERLGRNTFLCDFSEQEQGSALKSFLSGQKYDLVYLNTLESAHVLSFLTDNKLIGDETRVVSHIHELEGTIQKYGPNRIQILNKRADLIICVSGAVKLNLIEGHGFDGKKIHVVNPCSRDLSASSFNSDDQKWFDQIKNKKVILACGEISVGKGVDTFFRTAMSLKRFYQSENKPIDFVFVWLGPDSYKIHAYFERDLDILGLRDIIKIFTHRDSVYPFFERSDYFFMCSRQDSFPLVCLEAASMAKPILYFPDAGGIKDFLGADKGYPLPYQDFEASASLLKKLIESHTEAKAIGIAAQNAWHERFSAEKICSSVFALVKSLFPVE